MGGLLLAFWLLTAGDAATTCIGLSQGFQEMNPIYGSQPSCERVVATKLGAAVATTLIVLPLHKKYPKAAKIGLGISVGINGFAVTWNILKLFGT